LDPQRQAGAGWKQIAPTADVPGRHVPPGPLSSFAKNSLRLLVEDDDDDDDDDDDRWKKKKAIPTSLEETFTRPFIPRAAARER
jgi:hypothetical protein